jgi:amidohydrolase
LRPDRCWPLFSIVLSTLALPVHAAVDIAALDAATNAVMPQVVAWRRDIHQHPELSNREQRTSKLVADELRKLGLEVRTGIAHTGVLGVLKGGKPGPTLALRADMDALPVTEQVDVSFKSTVKTDYHGEQVGVMHACGHDAHTSILLGAAKVLSGMKSNLPGTVLFVFQPAEEGAPEGERGGAPLMLEEGVFANPKPEAMIGLHVFSSLQAGLVGYRSGPLMAGSDRFRIVVHGRQTHGGRPWGGIDPIVTASQIVLGMQTIVSRQVDITEYPAVVSVGVIKGGIRSNIIPESAELVGTYRTFDPEVRKAVTERIQRVATETAAAAGATADVEFATDSNPPVVNDPALTTRAAAALERALGKEHVTTVPYMTASEDFAWYGQKVPTFFFFVGSTSPGLDPKTAPNNHTPTFFLDESALPVGLRALLGVALDFLQDGPIAR